MSVLRTSGAVIEEEETVALRFPLYASFARIVCVYVCVCFYSCQTGQATMFAFVAEMYHEQCVRKKAKRLCWANCPRDLVRK